MKPIEELALVVGIFAGVYTLSRGLGGGGNTCGVPASAPSGTVQTAPFAGTAPSIPVPKLTNPFTSAPTPWQPPAPVACQPHMFGCFAHSGLSPTCQVKKLNASLGPRGGGMNGGGHYFTCSQVPGGIGYVCYN